MIREDDIGLYLISAVMGGIIVYILWTIQWMPYKDKLDECESTLPRNQHCVLVALPEEPAE